MPAPGPVHRFEALDMLRGVAALAVVMLHVPRPEGAAALLPRAYLAVDLFFALSGFVIAHAYWQRLREGETVGRFLAERLIRLYPLYLLATLFGGLLVLDATIDGGMPARSLANWCAALGANLLFLPAPPGNAGMASHLFPAAFPAWSLFWELIANLAFALVAPRLGPKLLGAILCLGLALLVWTGASFGTLDRGVLWSGFWAGGGRVVWSFFAGVAVYRIYRRYDISLRLPDWALAAALTAILATSFGGWPAELGLALFAFPLLVLLGVRARTTPVSRRIGLRLGELSYGAYVFHAPLLNLLDKLARSFTGHSLETVPQPLSLTLCLAFTLALASTATRRFDEPLRARLRARLRYGRVTTMNRAAR